MAEYLGERELTEAQVPERTLRAQAAIRREGRRWELRLTTELDGEPGERTLAASTCAAVADAAALVLALAIDPGAALRRRVPETPAPPRPAPAPARPAPVEPKRLHLLLAAGVRGDAGALPALSVGAALGAGVEQGRWALLASFSAFAGRATTLAQRPGAGGEFSLWAVSAAPCFTAVQLEPFWLRTCLPIEVQRLQARGYGVDEPAEARRSELTVGFELAPALSVNRHLELMVPIGAAYATRRPEFYLEQIGSVFRASVLQGRLGLGLLARF